MSHPDNRRGLLVEQLRRALNRSGLTQQETERRAGLSKSYLSDVLNGHANMSHPVAITLSEVLMAPAMADLSTAIHTRTCDLAECDRTFVMSGHRGHGNNRRFCSVQCKETGWKRSVLDRKANAATVTRHRLQEHLTAVAAYCAECSPEGICVMAACPLRSVSPFRLAGSMPIVEALPLAGRVPQRQDTQRAVVGAGSR